MIILDLKKKKKKTHEKRDEISAAPPAPGPCKLTPGHWTGRAPPAADHAGLSPRPERGAGHWAPGPYLGRGWVFEVAGPAKSENGTLGKGDFSYVVGQRFFFFFFFLKKKMIFWGC
jgi:hypothetical protein